LDHNDGLFSTAITKTASLSSLRAPHSSVLKPRRLSDAYPRSQGLGMELAGCEAAGSCREPAVATAERRGCMRRTFAACRAPP